MAEIKFSPDTIEDLKEIKKYIADELCNATAAQNATDKILNRIKQLEVFPLSGAPLDIAAGFPTDYRFLVCGSYIAFYRVDDDVVYVVRILYGRRDYAKLLFENENLSDYEKE